MQRIMIIGPPGSGKTTLGRSLSKQLHLPLHHLDPLFFEAKWKERPVDAFIQDHTAILKERKWIIDGNAIHHLGTCSRGPPLSLGSAGCKDRKLKGGAHSISYGREAASWEICGPRP